MPADGWAMQRLAPGGPFLAEREIPANAREQLEKKYGLDEKQDK